MIPLYAADALSQEAVNRWLLIAVLATVLLQLIAKLIMLGRGELLLTRVERVLRIVSIQASITDEQKIRVERTVETTGAEVKRAVERVPERTAERTIEKLRDVSASDSSQYNLSTVKPVSAETSTGQTLTDNRVPDGPGES